MNSQNQSAAKQAVALGYQQNKDNAPHVLAKGHGLVAEQIIARAQAAGLPLYHSEALLGLLMQVELDQEIPPSLYQVIAELLIWLKNLEVLTKEV